MIGFCLRRRRARPGRRPRVDLSQGRAGPETGHARGQAFPARVGLSRPVFGHRPAGPARAVRSLARIYRRVLPILCEMVSFRNVFAICETKSFRQFEALPVDDYTFRTGPVIQGTG